MTRASFDDIEDAIGQLELAKEAFRRADFSAESDDISMALGYLNMAFSRVQQELKYKRDVESGSQAIRPYQRRKPRQHP